MKEPDAPFFEFGLYYDRLPDETAFAGVVNAVEATGSKVIGIGVHRAPGIKEMPFVGPADLPIHTIGLNPRMRMADLCRDSDVRVVRVAVTGFLETKRGHSEIITYGGVLHSHAEHHPICVWASGDWMSPVGSNRFPRTKTIRDKGSRILKVFYELLRVTDPSYASMTSEYTMEVPVDLHLTGRSLAFENFYASRVFFGDRSINTIRRIVSEAYCEEVAGGIYVSTWAFLNPAGIELSSEKAGEVSCAVAKLIGNKRKKKRGRARLLLTIPRRPAKRSVVRGRPPKQPAEPGAEQ